MNSDRQIKCWDPDLMTLLIKISVRRTTVTTVKQINFYKTILAGVKMLFVFCVKIAKKLLSLMSVSAVLVHHPSKKIRIRNTHAPEIRTRNTHTEDPDSQH